MHNGYIILSTKIESLTFNIMEFLVLISAICNKKYFKLSNLSEE